MGGGYRRWSAKPRWRKRARCSSSGAGGLIAVEGSGVGAVVDPRSGRGWRWRAQELQRMVHRISPVAVMIQKSQPDPLAAMVGLSADATDIRARPGVSRMAARAARAHAVACGCEPWWVWVHTYRG